MSLGLESAGLLPGLAFDTDRDAVASHCANLDGPCLEADASVLTGTGLLEQVGLARGELALFSGGPPCQGFSKQKRGAHKGDARNRLVLEFARLVRGISPRSFMFENVAAFGKKRGQKYLELMYEELADYGLYPHFYNCADYGLAQTRKRFVMVGIRRDQRVGFRVPRPTVAEWRTVGQVLGGLPEPPEDCSVHPDYPNHQRARVTAINIERFSHVPQGGGWQDIPEHLRLPCHRNVDPKSGGWPDVYGRLEWDGQCPTITGGFDSFTRGRYGHPLRDRPLTPREAARLQGFPDEFAFMGTRQAQRRQIGNAVPPPLAAAVGASIIATLEVADGAPDEAGLRDLFFC
jgi:DNA (cytosine-5)-methyltransferase 1